MPVRVLYTTVFVGAAVLGTVASTGLRLVQRVPPQPPGPVTAAADPIIDSAVDTTSSAPAAVPPRVTVSTELIRVSPLRQRADALRQSRQATPRSLLTRRPSRSLLARVVLGNGEYRPRPFPSPIATK